VIACQIEDGEIRRAEVLSVLADSPGIFAWLMPASNQLRRIYGKLELKSSLARTAEWVYGA